MQLKLNRTGSGLETTYDVTQDGNVVGSVRGRNSDAGWFVWIKPAQKPVAVTYGTPSDALDIAREYVTD